MPRKKAVEETPTEPETPAADLLTEVAQAVAESAVAAVEEAEAQAEPAKEPEGEGAHSESWSDPEDAAAKPAEPEPEPPAEQAEAAPPEHVGFTRVHDPYSPSQDVVVRYPMPEVVTVTASWLSDAEAKVLRAQHQPVVEAANAAVETKAADYEI